MDISMSFVIAVIMLACWAIGVLTGYHFGRKKGGQNDLVLMNRPLFVLFLGVVIGMVVTFSFCLVNGWLCL